MATLPERHLDYLNLNTIKVRLISPFGYKIKIIQQNVHSREATGNDYLVQPNVETDSEQSAVLLTNKLSYDTQVLHPLSMSFITNRYYD